jgi:hypothetical protein
MLKPFNKYFFTIFRFLFHLFLLGNVDHCLAEFTEKSKIYSNNFNFK